MLLIISCDHSVCIVLTKGIIGHNVIIIHYRDCPNSQSDVSGLEIKAAACVYGASVCTLLY